MFFVFCFLAGLLAIAAIISVVSWVWYVPVVVRVFGETPWLQAESFQPLTDAEECEFPTSDGLMLRGSYLEHTAAERLGVVAFCHEMTGDRWGAIPYMENLRAEGFDVFTFDFRNHGTSDCLREYQPLPWLSRHEVTDVRAAIDYLCSRDDADPAGVGLMGVSKGAGAALCAAAGDSRVLAVVTDGAFPLDAMQMHYFRKYMSIYIARPHLIPDWCLVSFCEWAKFLVGLRRGCRFVDVEQAARSVRQPVLMIHGQRDNYVPIEVVHALRGCLAGRSRLWTVPGAKHNRAIQIAKNEYQRRIARFFRIRLGRRVMEPAQLAVQANPAA